jgi:hypothetical protein
MTRFSEGIDCHESSGFSHMVAAKAVHLIQVSPLISRMRASGIANGLGASSRIS